MIEADDRRSPDDQPAPPRSAEVDHRVANSLSVIAGLVRLKAARADGAADPRAVLLEVAERIDAVARLHRHIAHSPEGAVRLHVYLQEIGDTLSRALGRTPAELHVDCPPDIVAPFTIVLPIGLIAAELFSNSLKYAHPAGIPLKSTLICTRLPGGVVSFVYEDDGIGFPDGFDLAQDGNLGMRFIRALTEQIGAQRSWESSPLGIRFEMRVPLPDGAGAAD